MLLIVALVKFAVIVLLVIANYIFWQWSEKKYDPYGPNREYSHGVIKKRKAARGVMLGISLFIGGLLIGGGDDIGDSVAIVGGVLSYFCIMSSMYH